MGSMLTKYSTSVIYKDLSNNLLGRYQAPNIQNDMRIKHCLHNYKKRKNNSLNKTCLCSVTQ